MMKRVLDGGWSGRTDGNEQARTMLPLLVLLLLLLVLTSLLLQVKLCAPSLNHATNCMTKYCCKDGGISGR